MITFCPRSMAFGQTKYRLASIKRLYAWLLVHADYDCLVRWIHVEADYVDGPFVELWISAQLEQTFSMGLYLAQLPHSVNRKMTDSELLCEHPSAPVSRTPWLCVQCRVYYLVNHFFESFGFLPGRGASLTIPSIPSSAKQFLHFCHGVLVRMEILRYQLVLRSLGSQRHYV